MQRLDQLLFRRGLFASREKARRAVMAGQVQVDGQPAGKPGGAVPEDVELAVKGPAEPFVSRAGRKLAAALDHFGLDPDDFVCLDVGASTGGFTDCLLQRGAERVYAVDVGYGQLDYSLRQDARVVVLERVNARYLDAEAIPEPCDLVTLDLSFISLLKVVPSVLQFSKPGGWLMPMIKPQFEAGRELVGKGGLVRDESVRSRVVNECAEGIAALGPRLVGMFDSPVAGMKGNRESFALYEVGR
jgi:23S rRNA (cytidine1920-2'-O)/16S rRNA (cytidine1409-2'-O)-methyltransferase